MLYAEVNALFRSPSKAPPTAPRTSKGLKNLGVESRTRISS